MDPLLIRVKASPPETGMGVWAALAGKLVSWKASGGLRTAVRVRRPKHVRHAG